MFSLISDFNLSFSSYNNINLFSIVTNFFVILLLNSLILTFNYDIYKNTDLWIWAFTGFDFKDILRENDAIFELHIIFH